MKLKHKRLLRKGIVLLALVGLTVLTALLQRNQTIAEKMYARGLSRAYIFVFGHISSIFPFSLFDVFILCVIAIAILSVARLLRFWRKKRGLAALGTVTNLFLFVMTFVLLYTTVAGGYYHRTSAALTLPLYTGEELSEEEFYQITAHYLEDYARVTDALEFRDGYVVSPYTLHEMSDLLQQEYQRLSDDYYNSYTPAAKKTLLSFFMSYEGITGITFLPTGEAMVNVETPPGTMPAVMAHEMAHAKGVMTEWEANMVAYYILLTSDIPYFRYSAYRSTFFSLTSIVARRDYDKYLTLMEGFPENANLDIRTSYAFWDSKESFLTVVGEFFNDLYLKLNGAEEGTGSYGNPSKVQVVTPATDNKPAVIVIHYSETVRMLIENYYRVKGQ